MSLFANVPADVLAGAVEKLVAKMDEAELAGVFERDLGAMSIPAREAFVEAIFDAFRDRGESSEDAAEGAGTSLGAIHGHEGAALAALLRYARDNSGLLKEATTLFAEEHPDLIASLPGALLDAIAERLARTT